MKRGIQNEVNADPKRTQMPEYAVASGQMQFPQAMANMTAQAQLQQLLATSPGSYMGGGMPVSHGFEGMQHPAIHGGQVWGPGMAASSSAAAAAAAEEAAAEEARNVRGGYKCSKCGLPKKGHVCAYQPRLRRRDDENAKEQSNMGIQVEMDPLMTVRELDLQSQGTPESYQPILGTQRAVAEDKDDEEEGNQESIDDGVDSRDKSVVETPTTSTNATPEGGHQMHADQQNQQIMQQQLESQPAPDP